jgi:tRNA nucleotidyltransferase (CCA-adding enzyme)
MNPQMIPQYAKDVVRRLDFAGHAAYFVGGCVRDIFLGRLPNDFDIATEALPEQVTKLFPRVEPTGIKHGTVTVIHEGRPIEVTTFRSDGTYGDGRRPDEVTFGVTITEDLARRDFTMNAIAFSPYGEGGGNYVDPFNGLRDIAAKRIRCVGNPVERFREDGLRIARAFRFAAQLGFYIDVDTLHAMQGELPMLGKVAVERRTAEFMKWLVAPRAFDAACVVSHIPGWLDALIGCSGLYLDEDFDELPPTEIVRLAYLFQSWRDLDVRTQLRKMRLPSETIEKTAALVNLHGEARLCACDGYLVRRLLSNIRAAGLTLRDVLDVTGLSAEFVAFARAEDARNRPITLKDLAIDGSAITALGVQGREVGAALARCLTIVLSDPERNTREYLLEQVREHHTV